MKKIEYMLARPDAVMSLEERQAAAQAAGLRPQHGGVNPATRQELAKYTRHHVERGIGIIPIDGTLEAGLYSWWGISYTQVQSVIESFEENPEVKETLMVISSPGGASAGCPELAEFIRNTKKPVTAYVSWEACSAGYWIACAADKIYANKNSFVGSIGTCVNYHKAEGIEQKTIVSDQSPLKNLSPWTPEGEAQVKAHLNNLTESFILDVSTFRGVDSNKVRNDFGKGDIVYAENALAVGMIDGVMNYDTVLATLTNELTTGGAETTPAPGTQQNKTRSKKQMSRFKNTMVLIEPGDAGDEAEVIEVTVETLEANFPELVEEIRTKAKEDQSTENAATEEVAESADMEDEEQAEAVSNARKGDISAPELASKLLKIQATRRKEGGTEMAKRGQDNPEVQSGGGLENPRDEKTIRSEKVGTDMVDELKSLRGRKK